MPYLVAPYHIVVLADCYGFPWRIMIILVQLGRTTLTVAVYHLVLQCIYVIKLWPSNVSGNLSEYDGTWEPPPCAWQPLVEELEELRVVPQWKKGRGQEESPALVGSLHPKNWSIVTFSSLDTTHSGTASLGWIGCRPAAEPYFNQYNSIRFGCLEIGNPFWSQNSVQSQSLSNHPRSSSGDLWKVPPWPFVPKS